MKILENYICEEYTPEMLKFISPKDLKIVSRILNNDWGYNIQSTKFTTITHYIDASGHFIFNARKPMANNPTLIVVNKTRKIIDIVRFDGYGGEYFSFPFNGYYRKPEKTIHFNTNIKTYIKNGDELAVFCAFNPVRDRNDIRKERSDAQDITDTGTIQDRLARKKFEELKKSIYFGKDRRESLKNINSNLLSKFSKAILDINPDTTFISSDIEIVKNKFSKSFNAITSYELNLEDIEKMISNEQYRTNYGKTFEEKLKILLTAIDNLKKEGLVK